jgi:hypothetical protein
MLLEKSKFRIKPDTLSKEMRKFMKRYGEAPVEPLYKVNQKFFERHPPKPPKHYHRGIDEKNLTPHVGG